MSHPSFVLEWKDGRMLLIDVGMTARRGASPSASRSSCSAAPTPIVPHGLGRRRRSATRPRASRASSSPTCTPTTSAASASSARASAIRVQVPMTEAQAERPNYTTRPGLDLLDEADCVAARDRVSGGAAVAGAGLSRRLRDRRRRPHAGQPDHARLRAGRRRRRTATRSPATSSTTSTASPTTSRSRSLYRTLIVPESEARQAELRAFLKRLHDEAGFTLLVSHDQRALEAGGVPAWDEHVTSDRSARSE